jgi:hypothetical protein
MKPTPRAASILLAMTAPPAAAMPYVARFLDPPGFVVRSAYGAGGGGQAGFGVHDTGYAHALLWTGSSAAAVDLHPSGFVETQAFAAAESAGGRGQRTCDRLVGTRVVMAWNCRERG